MKFKKYKLGDLLRVTRGASLAGTGYADEGKYLRLTLANFNEEGGFKEFKSTQGKYFTDTFDRRFLMHKGDLITPLTEQSPGLLGSVAFIPCDNLYIQSQDVGLITCNTEKLDKTFAYYLFLTHSVREQISARSQQTKIRHTSPDKIADVEVFIPDLSTQLRIAGVLGSLDEKIALNRKKIAELEALSKTIYDYWFVQFDFPDKYGRPYKSSGGKMVWNEQLKREVPDGWEVTQIGKHIKSNRGVSYSTKNISSGSGIPMVNLNSFNVASTYKVAGIKTFEGKVPNSKLLKPFDLVMCNTQQTDLDPKKDIIGKSFLVPDIFNLDITSSHHVTTIHVDDDALKVFLNALFQTNEFHAYISGFASGTSIRGLDFFGVESCYVVMPPKPLLSKFAQLVMACEKQKSIVLRDQSLLQPLRDYLLPLLMNGQVTIGDLK